MTHLKTEKIKSNCDHRKCELGCEELTFATNKQLKYHMLSVHEKEKQFNCNLCDYSSVTKSNLNRHISDVHEDNR